MTPRGPSSRWTLVSLLTAVALFGASCAADARQTTLKPKGPQAEKINDLINPIFGIAGLVFFLVLGGAIWVGIKFRAKDDTDYDEFPEQVHGNFKLEIGWTIVPAVILLVVGVLTVVNIFDLARPAEKDAVRVEVIGQQWWWEYRYDLNNDGTYDEIITANDLVIPADQQVELMIRSRDVIHSWWMPSLNGKKDAVPGRVHPLTIQADKPGEYIGQCTEFCGLSHAEMRIKVVALDDAGYEAWTANQQSDFVPPIGESANAGWAAIAGQCTSCHRLTGMTDPDGSGKVFSYDEPMNQVSGAAPNLAHFMSRSTFAGGKFYLRKDTEVCTERGVTWAQQPGGIDECLDRNALEAWLKNPPGQKAMYPGDAPSPESRGMPNFNLTDGQIDDLVEFLKTLK